MDLLTVVPDIARLHAVSAGHPDVRVAILDGPVDLAHPCFRGASLEQVPTLVTESAGPGRMSLHGTHVASIVFGQPGSPVSGAAPGCHGLVLPVFRDHEEGRLPQLDLARAIERAVAEGAHVINISGGERSADGRPDPLLARALRTCADNNVLVVAAAGNDGCNCLHVPAAVPSVLAVGALGRNGLPLATSNWGEAYQENGVLAPGESIPGAAPGGGTAQLTGTSFAAPIVTGIAALLLSIEVDAGRKADPMAVREAILSSVSACQPTTGADCRKYLAGALSIPLAYANLMEERPSVTDSEQTAGTLATSESEPQRVAQVTDTAVRADAPASAGPAPLAALPWAGQLAPPVGTTFVHPGYDFRQGYGVGSSHAEAWPQGAVPQLPVPYAHPQVAALHGVPAQWPARESVPQQVVEGPGARVVAGQRGVEASDGCSCKSAAPGPTLCDCQVTRTQNVYALGTIGFDFGTEARRDTFRQLMPDVEQQQEGQPPVSIKANPYDPFQLADYLDDRPSESTNLIWTLNLDLTPIYALEADPTYPEEVYQTFRDALRRGALPIEDEEYVARISIPGMLTNRTVQLFSGQTVQVVRVIPRGLYTWRETKLVDGVIQALQGQLEIDEEYVRRMIRTFLDKVYFECRNLGLSPSDRALNFSATNAYQFGQGIADGFLSGINMVPGAERELYTLDSIDVSKSPYCRMDSDCWDVRIRFFDPVNDRRAKSVYQFTIDVSDTLPVTLAPFHRYLTT